MNPQSTSQQKRSHDQLREILAETAKVINIGAIYQHFKSEQSLFKVLSLSFGEGFIDGDEIVCVNYCAVESPDIVFTRPLSSFLSDKELNGQIVKRFKPVEL